MRSTRQSKKKEDAFLVVSSSALALGLPCFSTVPSSYDVDVFAGGFAPALASWFPNEGLVESVR